MKFLDHAVNPRTGALCPASYATPGRIYECPYCGTPVTARKRTPHSAPHYEVIDVPHCAPRCCKFGPKKVSEKSRL